MSSPISPASLFRSSTRLLPALSAPRASATVNDDRTIMHGETGGCQRCKIRERIALDCQDIRRAPLRDGAGDPGQLACLRRASRRRMDCLQRRQTCLSEEHKFPAKIAEPGLAPARVIARDN